MTKFGMLIFMLLPLLGNVYVLWHVWRILPLPSWAKVVVVRHRALGSPGACHLSEEQLVGNVSGDCFHVHHLPLWQYSLSSESKTASDADYGKDTQS